MGMYFFPWQETVLMKLFAVDANGNWANKEYGILVARQQGKSYILAAYLLAHLFLFPSEDERQKNILFSAHRVDTTAEIFKRVVSVIRSNEKLEARLAKEPNMAEGRELILLEPGANQAEGMGTCLRTLSRAKGGGRGFSYQIMCFDEAQIMKQETMNALDFTQSTFTNTQMLFVGTVPQPEDVCDVFQDLRDRGRTPAGENDATGWAEWSPEGADDPDKALTIDFSDPDVWAQGNPSMGHWKEVDPNLPSGIKPERIQGEYDKNKMNPEDWAKERLSLWPSRRPEEEARYNDLDLAKWEEYGLNRTDSNGNTVPKEDDGKLARVSDDLDKAWAIVPTIGQGGGYASVCAATILSDGRVTVYHLKSDTFPRTWMAEYLVEVQKKFPKSKLFMDNTHYKAMDREFQEVGIDPVQYMATYIATAFDNLHELYQQGKVTHYNQPELLQSFSYAQPRKVGNMGYTWEGSNPNISPTHAQAATLAVYAAGDTKNFKGKEPGKFVRLNYR